MAEPAKRPATYDDVLQAPEGMTAEILNGELHLSPRPSTRHALAETGIVGDVRDEFGRRGGPGPGGWWIVVEPELHLGDPDPTSLVAVPDIAGWRRARLPAIPDANGFTVPPDWICEVLSPGPTNTRRDRLIKPDIYASRGVAHLWLVDPIGQLLEVFRLDGSTYRRVQVFGGDERVRAEPFDAVELDMGGWWLPSETE